MPLIMWLIFALSGNPQVCHPNTSRGDVQSLSENGISIPAEALAMKVDLHQAYKTNTRDTRTQGIEIRLCMFIKVVSPGQAGC